MNNQFKSKRATLWLGGVAVLILGLLAAAVVLPMTSKTPGTGGPEVHVPSMQNIPADEAPKMKLDLEKQR